MPAVCDRTAFFNNAEDVVNIFSRVTGGNISDINGLIGANGGANLFIINPAGIIFGENASLDIGGSFYGSTANSILFPDSIEFSAADTQPEPLLTINAPIGLNLGDNPGDIVNRSTSNNVGLQVAPGKNLALIGGNVNLEGGLITAPGGIVELGGLLATGEIGIDSDGSFSFPEAIVRADVFLTNNSEVNVRAGGGGFININAKNLFLSGQSRLFAGIAEDMGAPEAQAGDIIINSTESVRLISNNQNSSDFIGLGTEINNHLGSTISRRDNPDDRSNATGNGGNIVINTRLLEISQQARITANSFSLGNSGDISIDSDNITIDGGAIATLVSEGSGDVGDVTINNTGSFVLNEDSNIQSQVVENGEGNAGDIKINTETLSINEKFSFILADNTSSGDAGNITIDAGKSVFVDGGGEEDLGEKLSAIITQVQQDVIGNAGDINISTPQLSLTNFALISTSVKNGSVGRTGNIFLDVGVLSLTNGAVIEALTENDSDGGSININAGVMSLSNGGKIVTSGDGGGSAGSINLNISDTLTLRNGNPPSETPFDESILQDTALETGLFASTVGDSVGDGGSINVEASSIQLDRGSIIATTSSGTGGNVSLEIDDALSLGNGSLISAQADSIGDGGNINIDSDFVIAFPNSNSDIVANAFSGNGGRIEINTQGLFGIESREELTEGNDINASSEFGFDGVVEIDPLEIDPTLGLTKLPTAFVVTQPLQGCQANRESDRSSFINTGRGGLPPSPYESLNNDNMFDDVQLPSQWSDRTTTNSVASPPKTPSIVEANTWVVNQNGNVELIADRTISCAEETEEDR